MNRLSTRLAIAFFAISVISASAQTNPQPEWTSPAGSWEGVVTSIGGGPPPFRMLMTFMADGGFIGSADGDNAVASLGHGVWQRIGDRNSRTYSATFRQIYYLPDSTPTGSVTVRQKVTLNAAGDFLEGPAEVKMFLPDGTLVFVGSATAEARRIVSEPLL